MRRSQQQFLYVTVFAGGMATLGIELTIPRLLGPVYGSGNVIWSGIIALVLLYLTAGYFLGGWLADRYPATATLYRLICIGALAAALIPAGAYPLLQKATHAGDTSLIGSFIGVLLLCSIPVTLLGTISPFAIRLAIPDTQSAGRIAGRVYAISTIGSIIGTFLPALVLNPLLGTHLTFLAFASLLMLVGLIGLWLSSVRHLLPFIWMPVVVLALSIYAA